MIANRVRMSKIDKGWDGIFADPEVGRVLKLKGLIADANKSSIKELASIKSLNPGGEYDTSYFYNNKTITQFPELQYCTGLTSLNSTFSGCSSLTTAPVIPEGVTILHDTFYRCSSLTTAPVIPEGVTNLQGTFWGCSSLTTAPVIPEGVTSLRYTFEKCTSIDGVFTIEAVSPPTYNDTFKSVNVKAIYVPDASVNTYKSASGWSNHSSKIYPMSTKP